MKIIIIAVVSLFFMFQNFPALSQDLFAYDISRMQIRSLDDGSQGGSFSSFWLFGNGLFVLPIYEVDYKEKSSERLDVMVGKPLSSNGDVGLIARYQSINWGNNSLSYGLQYNFHRNKILNNYLSKFCIKSFAQIYKINDSESIIGEAELYLRLQSGCSKSIYHRGVMQQLFNTEKGSQTITFNDFFYRINKYSEIYLRHQYLTHSNIAYGREGSSFGVGLRFSKSFLN